LAVFQKSVINSLRELKIISCHLIKLKQNLILPTIVYFCRMKQKLQGISLLVLALILLLFGNSVRVWHFCCELCRENSLEIMFQGNCEPVHHCCSAADAADPWLNHTLVDDNNTLPHNTSCSNTSGQAPGCYSETITIPFESSHKLIKFLPVGQFVQVLVLPLNLFKDAHTATTSFAPHIAARSSGRLLLSLHCVLRS
jgi:hypothetical protein